MPARNNKVGRIGERIAEKLFPGCVIVNATYDIMFNKTKIEVKTSNKVLEKKHKGEKRWWWVGWRFTTKSHQRAAADFFLLICLDEDKFVKALYIPSFLMPETQNLKIHEAATKWDEFIYPAREQ